MLTNLVPDLKQVFTPALVSDLLSWYDRPPGIYGMHANGLYSSLNVLSSLNGSTSKRLSGISLLCAVFLDCVYLFLSFFLGWDVMGGLYSVAMAASLDLSWPLSS